MDLDALLDRLNCLRGRPRQIVALDGGLTNHNYRVTTQERDVVVRVSTEDNSLLAIDRAAEYANSCAAAASGVAPEVVEYSQDDHLLVVAYAPGRTLQPNDLRDREMLRRLAAACRQLHSGPRFVTDFNVFEVQQTYLATVRERGLRLPDGYLKLEPQITRVEAVLRTRPMATVPCHNDLLAANVIDGGSRLWLIDYEYAGNNDPCFELGNLASESHLCAEEITCLVDSYFGGHEPHLVARAQLLGVTAQYSWVLWASIQDASSSLDFDYWTWGMDKYDQAASTLEGSNLEALLSVASYS